MSAFPHGSRTVTVSSRALWGMRLGRELPRYLLYALAVFGVVASARFAIDPPLPALPAALLRAPAVRDIGAEGFAALFARHYLTWGAQDPEAREQGLTPFVGPGLDADAGLQPPVGGEQRVQWAEVVQERSPQPGEHVYTVAAQTDSAGLVYLTVSVLRKADGALALAGYPGFVGPPEYAPAQVEGGAGTQVEDPALVTVVERALHNYLGAAAGELAADLSSGARISLPGIALALQSVQSLRWVVGGGAVEAVVQAQDQRGAQYTLAYELDVTRAQGRWEIGAIEMEPQT